MPDASQVAKFKAGENKWNDNAPAKQVGGIGNSGFSWGNTLNDQGLRELNALSDLLQGTFHIQEAPQSRAEYEERKAAMIAVAESQGQIAYVRPVPEHSGTVNGIVMLIPYQEEFVVSDGPGTAGAVLYQGFIQQAMDFTGLVKAESWFRAEWIERSKEIRARQEKTDRARREYELRKEEALNQPVYGWQLEEVKEDIAAIRALLEKLAGNA